MAFQWLRRAGLLAACATALLLAACGGGSIVSSFVPTRVVAFGDAMGDLGQNGQRYTINDGSTNVWTQHVANAYGRSLASSATGGLSFATGNARVVATPDAAGNAGTPTVKQQIDAFLASSTLSAEDLVLVSAGTSDVIAQAKAVMDGTIPEAVAQQNVQQAADELAVQIRRLIAAGATHIAVAGPANLGRTPWAIQTGQGGLLGRLSLPADQGSEIRGFNNRLLISLNGLGATVLYLDAAFEYNQATGSPSSFDLSDVSTPVCTSVDPGPGIGTGAGQVNSNLCTPSTVVTGSDPNRFLWADRVYPTPRGQRIFGDFAFNRIHERW